MAKPKTVRVDDALWKEFREWCQSGGTYPRHVLEAVIIDWMAATSQRREKLMNQRSEWKKKRKGKP